MRGLGFIESGVSKNDIIYGSMYGVPESVIPEEYEVKDQYRVIDQGNIGCCVSCAAMEMLHTKCRYNKTKKPSNYRFIFDLRADKSVDGMMPREAFEILKKEGYISLYAKINSEIAMKQSIIANGPAMIGLIVRSNGDEFWRGSDNLGGHAVAVVGYDKYGYIIKNSWGTMFGNGGYITLPYSDFKVVREAWTIIE